MLPQRPRPQPAFREFIPQPILGARITTFDTHVMLSLLCLKCARIRDWIRDNLRALREISPLEDQNYSNTKATFSHHGSGRQLHESSEDGCHLCTIIWENLIEMDSHWVKTEDHWTSERLKMTDEVLQGNDLRVRVFVPRSIHRSGAFGSDQLKYLAFAQLRAYIRIENDDEPIHNSNPMMVCAVQMDEVDDLVLKSKSADKLKPFRFKRPHDAIDNKVEPAFGLPEYDSDSGELLSKMDLQFKKFFENMGPREFLPNASKCTGCVENKDMALKWLTTCVKTHRQCAASKAIKLPTRLIDISGSGTDSVRLINSKDLMNEDDTRYACLSYCWGREEAYTLTLDNVDKSRDGIEMDLLPKTIQDAIEMTGHLGLKLIWIDALCIIQDSKEDWEQEAARMCDVYEGCFVCIAAKGASSASEGLFSMRDPLRHTPCHLFRTDSGESIYVPSPYITTRSQSRKPWALDRRGWVVQERILPPRNLNFGTYMSWECRQGLRDEFDIEEVADFDRLVASFYKLVVDAPSRLNGEREAQVISFWNRILALYSDTALTVNSDRYAALYGIITAIKRLTGWHEIAGIWEPYFIQGLLWSPSTGVPTAPEPGRTGLSPTWSWISVACEITWISTKPDDEELVTIKPEYPSDPDEELIATSAARLLVDGLLIPVKRMIQAAPARYKCRLVGWPHEDSVTAIYDIDDQSIPVSQQTFLPLLFSRTCMRGLLLCPSKKGGNTFERIGNINVNFMTRRRPGKAVAAAAKSGASTPSDSGSADWDNSDPETDEEEQDIRRSARREALEQYQKISLTLI